MPAGERLPSFVGAWQDFHALFSLQRTARQITASE
jgi:hypothetical protein